MPFRDHPEAILGLCPARENVRAMAAFIKNKPGIEWELIHAQMANLAISCLIPIFRARRATASEAALTDP